MDPILISLVAALAAGASSAAGDVAGRAIKDAYAGLRQLVIDRYGGAADALKNMENAPASQVKQQELAEVLAKLGAARDTDLKTSTENVLGSIERLQPALVDVEVLRALKNFTIRDVEHIGTLLRARKVTVEGDMVIEGIRTGQAEKH